MSLLYKDMTGPDGSENNMGGTSSIIYYASVSDILTFSQASAVVGANPFVMTQAFVMKTGKKFYQLYTTIDTSEIDAATNGGIDGKSFKPSFKMHHPGFSDDAILFMNTIKNDKLIMLIPLADGKIFQMGNDRFFCYANPAFKSTKVSGDGRGFDLEFMSWQPNLVTYAAAVPLAPAA